MLLVYQRSVQTNQDVESDKSQLDLYGKNALDSKKQHRHSSWPDCESNERDLELQAPARRNEDPENEPQE